MSGSPALDHWTSQSIDHHCLVPRQFPSFQWGHIHSHHTLALHASESVPLLFWLCMSPVAYKTATEPAASGFSSRSPLVQHVEAGRDLSQRQKRSLFHLCVNGKHYICIATALLRTWIWAVLKPAEAKNRLDVAKLNQGERWVGVNASSKSGRLLSE